MTKTLREFLVETVSKARSFKSLLVFIRNENDRVVLNTEAEFKSFYFRAISKTPIELNGDGYFGALEVLEKILESSSIDTLTLEYQSSTFTVDDKKTDYIQNIIFTGKGTKIHYRAMDPKTANTISNIPTGVTNIMFPVSFVLSKEKIKQIKEYYGIQVGLNGKNKDRSNIEFFSDGKTSKFIFEYPHGSSEIETDIQSEISTKFIGESFIRAISSIDTKGDITFGVSQKVGQFSWSSDLADCKIIIRAMKAKSG